MIERFLSGKSLLVYLNLKERLGTPLLFLAACLLFGGGLLDLKQLRQDIRQNSDFTEFAEAVVVHSTIIETELSRDMHLHAQTASGANFYLLSSRHDLYALQGENVCLEIRQIQEPSAETAQLTAPSNCSTRR